MSEPSSHIGVSQFLELGRARLDMELVAGAKGLSHRIPEAAINRPGLALSGFFEHFAKRRIQVLGLAEYAYLSSLQDNLRKERLEAFFACKMPCVVFTRSKKLFPEVSELADRYRVPVLRSRLITKHFVNAATIIMENLAAPRQKAQGTMVEIMGIGVLIRGKAGLGKSETALGLIKRGHALVSDDITGLRVDSAGRLIGAPLNVTRYHMEIRGVGIIHVPSLFGVSSVREEKKLDLVATLYGADDRPGEEDERNLTVRKTTTILGVEMPHVLIRVAPGRDLVNLIETAALDQKLRNLGHDAAKELDERLISLLSVGGAVGSE